jgi:hypothetical protein
MKDREIKKEQYKYKYVNKYRKREKDKEIIKKSILG